VRARLDSWSGIGLIGGGMTHQGWDVQLTAYAARDWRANFFPVGIAHSVVGGSAWEPTPWRAVQRAESCRVPAGIAGKIALSTDVATAARRTLLRQPP
jgi:hypothetical protein